MNQEIINNLKVKIFADGADEKGIRDFYDLPYISGFTTNPTLMRQAGVDDYERFARNMLEDITDKPLSFEVFSDDLKDMARQARLIRSWGDNVYVKIPITNTKQECAADLIGELLAEGTKLNITAILTKKQMDVIRPHFDKSSVAFISVFAGRIADTGADPLEWINYAIDLFKDCPKTESLWASCREVLNIFQADEAGCDIITVSHGLIKKLELVGKDLAEYSLDTVKMFYHDASDSGFKL